MALSTETRPEHLEVPAGYQFIESISANDESRIIRALRELDGQSVILKILKPDSASRERIALLQHEFDILDGLEGEQVISVHELAYVHDLPVIVMEDIGGQSLNRLLANRHPSLKACIGIARAIATALKDIHNAGIIHKDVNPANIVVNPKTGAIRLIDFGIATRYSRQQALLASPPSGPGTPGYMSPEQTGRMNRPVDYRSDFYSLGATLYELVTERPLFTASEPIEWFHCHIARTPVSPAGLNSSIPGVLSDLIMKLLSKTAEDRYQSAAGLLHDLQECHRQLSTQSQIVDFPLATRDVPEYFRIPQRLYGRDKEVGQLLTAFEKAYDTISLALVSGRSGIGKSSLINELHKPVTARRGYLIAGKFDLVHRDIPYSGLIIALRDLIQQVLTESAERLATWKQKLEEALGPNAGLMTALLPELELIMGPQPDVAPASATESEQRFRLTLFSFVRVFSYADHPLVLVLDDLQWADSSTLRLADLLIDQMEGDRLMVVGAYRDNEITPDHALITTLQQVQGTDVHLTQIDLQPLNTRDICELLSDTLVTTTAEVEPLAKVVRQKTEGNPFFVEEFLKDQHQRGNITFNTKANRWAWDIDQLTQQQMTDNVAGLMTRKLEGLPPESLELLRLAACAGNRFSLSMLSAVAEMAPARVAKSLNAPILEGLIVPIRDSYQLTELEQDNGIGTGKLTVQFAFTHDRIQETAYDLLDGETQASAHLQIGRQLLRNLDAADRKDGLFAIVTHLNTAVHLIDNPDEKRELCRLNLEAGHRARQAASYPIAYNYFQKAVLLLGKSPWATDYSLALSAFGAAAEAAAYEGDFKGMQMFIRTGLDNARDLLSKVAFHEIEIGYLIKQGELQKAIDQALPLLAELGHHYPRRPKRFHVVLRFLKLKSRLKSINLETVRDQPDMTSARHRAACRIGASIGSASMFTEPMLLPLMCIRAVETSLEHGHSPESSIAFGLIGMMYAESLHDPDTAIALGRLSLDLSERYNSRRGRALHVFASLILHWKEPVHKTYDVLRTAARHSMENGDFEYAVHATNILGEYMLLGGADLEKLENRTVHDLSEFRALHMGTMLFHQESRLQLIRNLRGFSTQPARLVGDAYDIQVMLPRHREAHDYPLVEQVLSKDIYLRYLFDEEGSQDRALKMAEDMLVGASGGAAFYGGRWTLFLRSLVLLRSAGTAKSRRQRRRLISWARKDMKKMKVWVAHDPFNFANKHYLARAEYFRVIGKDFEAHEAFDQAVTSARENQLLNEQALACELCGKMHMEAGRYTIGEPYLAKARELYGRWGAHGKVRQLKQRYPQIGQDNRLETLTGTRAAGMGEIDMSSLMKALRAIADEQIHSRMVASIIDIALEFAGAQRGILALRDGDGRLRIEAEASVDQAETTILQSSPLEQCESVSQTTVNYVSRTMESVVVADALTANSSVPGLEREEYILRERVRSILCLPITTGAGKERTLIGLLYLENNHISNCFTEARIDALEIISVAAAGRLELSRKASVDGLTSLFNHEYFQNMLRQELANVARYDRELSIVLIDIDHFKVFNDTWGHPLGDLVLREVADLIRQNSRENDTAARYGGEEMVVILPGAGTEEASQVAERIRLAIENHQIKVDDEVLGITVSMGLATATAASVDPEKLIKKADMALYNSKANGRNQLTIAD